MGADNIKFKSILSGCRKAVAVALLAALSVGILTACAGGNEPDPITSYMEQKFDFSAHGELYQNVISSQEEYLKSLVLPSGSLCKWSGGTDNNAVSPYFACFAALSLLENSQNTALVKAYCDWHFSALNSSGDYNGVSYTIYDYEVISGAPVPLNFYDSTDSYAAVFLMLLNKYYAATGDLAYIEAHRTEINGVTSAMLSTYYNGLTYAKPDYQIQYLMDNSEVYGGLDAAEKLFDALGDSDKKAEMRQKKTAVRAAIKNLYNKTASLYLPYKGAPSVGIDKFYPDAAAQLYPVIFGAATREDDISVAVYSAFKTQYPSPEALDQADVFPWTIIAYAAYLYGDYGYATSLLDFAYKKYMSANAYPWYAMEGALSLLTARKLSAMIN